MKSDTNETPDIPNVNSVLRSMDRRKFLKSSAIGAGLMVLPSYVAGQSKTQMAPSSRVNIAIVGVGGRGWAHVDALKDENIVALCDVNMHQFEEMRRDTRDSRAQANIAILDGIEGKGARWFMDYREMFAEMGDEIDAVVITTPDHMHFPVAMSAVNLGKHVYCEKPLTHVVGESRMLAEAAKKAGVITQMGNQGHSYDGARLIREWVQAGVIGAVREIHSWTNRPIWPQGMHSLPDHSTAIPVIPKGLDWNLWLGIAGERAYDPAFVPFKWRGWWEYGTGAIGDMACHVMDGAYWGLDLLYPTSVEAVAATPVSDLSPPEASMLRYEFPARGSMPEVTYTWYDGGLLPPVPDMLDERPSKGDGSGTFIVGEEGVILTDTYSRSAQILPSQKMIELRPRFPERTLRRIKGSHQMEWVNAIREGRQATSDFSYAGPFTETALLGTVALRAGKKIEFDAKAMKVTNLEEANQYLTKEYPKGWILS